MIMKTQRTQGEAGNAIQAEIAIEAESASGTVGSSVAPSIESATGPTGVFAGAGWLAMCKLGSQIFSWIGTFYVASKLLPADYGLSNLSTAFTEFAVILTNLGIGTTLVQRKEVDPERADTLFTATVIMGLLLASSAIGLSYFGSWYFRNPALLRLTQFTAVIYLLSSMTIVPYNFLNRDMRFRERGLLDMYSVVVSITLQMALAALGFGVWTLLWGSAVRFMVRLGLAFMWSGYRPALRFKWTLLKEDIGFSAQLTLNWLLFVMKERSIPIIMGRAYSVAQLGLLGFAGSLSGIPNLKVVQLLREVLLPLLAKRSHSPEAQLRGLGTALRGMCLLVVPMYLCGYYYGEDTLSLILPPKWVPMFPIFQVLCLVQLWNVLASIISIYNTAQGKPVRSTWFELAMALIIPGATFIFRRLDLVPLAHIWSALGAVVFMAWFAIQFHREGLFLRHFLGRMLAVTAVCGGLFAVDAFFLSGTARFGAHAHAHVLAAAPAWAELSFRIAFFIAGYLAYLRITQWDFLKGLRKK
jgi:O-antigen/teichoic acid export membrane protein